MRLSTSMAILKQFFHWPIDFTYFEWPSLHLVPNEKVPSQTILKVSDQAWSDAPGDGLRWKRTFKRSFPESFIKIGHQKPCQDSTYPPSLSLESWRMCHMIGIIIQKLLRKFHQDSTSQTLSRLHLSSKSLPGVLEDMEVPDAPGDGLRWKRKSKRSFPESFMKIGHQKPSQDSTCHPSLFLEFWRTWRFLMYLVIVSDEREHPREASLKVSWRLDNRNPVKTPPVLHVSSWSLGGCGGSWRTWWWSQIEENILENLPWKFHEDWTSESLSRLHLSS